MVDHTIYLKHQCCYESDHQAAVWWNFFPIYSCIYFLCKICIVQQAIIIRSLERNFSTKKSREFVLCDTNLMPLVPGFRLYIAFSSVALSRNEPSMQGSEPPHCSACHLTCSATHQPRRTDVSPSLTDLLPRDSHVQKAQLFRPRMLCPNSRYLNCVGKQTTPQMKILTLYLPYVPWSRFCSHSCAFCLLSCGTAKNLTRTMILPQILLH